MYRWHLFIIIILILYSNHIPWSQSYTHKHTHAQTCTYTQTNIFLDFLIHWYFVAILSALSCVHFALFWWHFFFISPRASFIIFKIFQNFALAKEHYNQIAENSEWSYENCDENCMDIVSAFSSLSTTSLRYNLFTSKINKNINIRVPLAVKLILFISLQENLWKRSPWIFCFYFVLFLSGITPISYL